jgi:hypothetical protein
LGGIPEGALANSRQDKKTIFKKKQAERISAHWQERQVENKQAGGKNCQQEGQLVRAKFI